MLCDVTERSFLATCTLELAPSREASIADGLVLARARATFFFAAMASATTKSIWAFSPTTKRLGITFGGRLRVPLGLSEYPDHFEDTSGLYASHDSSFGTRARPMGGFVIMYNNAAVDWGANRLKIVSPTIPMRLSRL